MYERVQLQLFFIHSTKHCGNGQRLRISIQHEICSLLNTLEDDAIIDILYYTNCDSKRVSIV